MLPATCYLLLITNNQPPLVVDRPRATDHRGVQEWRVAAARPDVAQFEYPLGIRVKYREIGEGPLVQRGNRQAQDLPGRDRQLVHGIRQRQDARADQIAPDEAPAGFEAENAERR